MIVIACLVTGVSTTAFLTLWFVTVYRELILQKRAVEDLENQVVMHQELFAQARGTMNETVAERMLENSRYIYQEGIKSYDAVLVKNINRFPAWVMGFRVISKEKQI